MKAPIWPPVGYTIRHEENAGTMFYRAIRTSGTEWQSPLLRATYDVALRDAEYARDIWQRPAAPRCEHCGRTL